jgi:hypothetical protein
VGEPFSGDVATVNICQGQTVVETHASIDWSDGPVSNTNVLGGGRIAASHTYSREGKYPLSVTVSATCNWNNTIYPNSALGVGLFDAYRAIPLKALSVTPSSVQGGESGTGVVELEAQASIQNELVFVHSDDRSIAVPDVVIVPAKSRSQAFRVETSSVSQPKTVKLVARSGGVSKFTVVTLTP